MGHSNVESVIKLIALLIGVSIAIFLYLLPYFIARRRRVATRGFLLLVNILGGFTGIGWLVSLIWAIFGETELQRRYLEQLDKDSSARREPRP